MEVNKRSLLTHSFNKHKQLRTHNCPHSTIMTLHTLQMQLQMCLSHKFSFASAFQQPAFKNASSSELVFSSNYLNTVKMFIFQLPMLSVTETIQISNHSVFLEMICMYSNVLYLLYFFQKT